MSASARLTVTLGPPSARQLGTFRGGGGSCERLGHQKRRAPEVPLTALPLEKQLRHFGLVLSRGPTWLPSPWEGRGTWPLFQTICGSSPMVVTRSGSWSATGASARPTSSLSIVTPP